MSVISITIQASTEQLIAGIPKTIALSANIPSTIFYTLDGSDPTTSSSVYTSIIKTDSSVSDLVLKVFATNGPDSSPIITQEYSTNILHNTRMPHAAVHTVSNSSPRSLFPFGTNSPSPNFDYINSANAGTTVDNPSLPIIPYGFDANGNPVGANQPIDSYQNIYSTTNYKNQVTPNVGNLPGTVTIIGRRSALSYTTEESSRQSPMFDARAMVIFQDSETDDPSNPVQINPQMFSMENLEITKDGAVLKAGGFSPPGITGSFIRGTYNPRTQMITYSYRDSSTNRWIFSSTPYQPKDPDAGNLSGMVFGRSQGLGKIYSWSPYRYHVLT